MSRKTSEGFLAEEFIAAELKRHGWQILAQNYRRRGTEIDIIASKNEVLSFVEVKARKHMPQYGLDLELLVPTRKKEALKRGALSFLSEKNPNHTTIRFDLFVVKIKNDPLGVAKGLYFENFM